MVKMGIPDIRIYVRRPRIAKQFKDINSKFKELAISADFKGYSFIIVKT